MRFGCSFKQQLHFVCLKTKAFENYFQSACFENGTVTLAM